MLALLPLVLDNPYITRLAGRVVVYGIIGLGLQTLFGLLGILDLGFILYPGIGAYAFALLTTGQLGLRLSPELGGLLAIVAAALTGLVVSLMTMRLNGDYLAIAALALAEAFRLTVLNLDRPVNITNGPNGLVGVAGPRWMSGMGSLGVYVALSAIGLGTLALYSRLRRSRTGADWKCVKEDPLSAQAVGINPRLSRVAAYVVAAASAGLGGVCWAIWQGAVFPDNFSMMETVNFYCLIVLGGIGNPIGTLIGAAVLVLLPEALRDYSTFRMLIYGVMLIVLVRFKPDGLLKDYPLSAPSACGGTAAPTPCGKGERVLSCTGLTRRFGGLTAVRGVDLEIRSGEIVGLIGPNGAGKTTLLNLLSGFERPDSGRVRLCGVEYTAPRPHVLARRGLARTFQRARLAAGLTVGANVVVGRRRHEEPRLLLDSLSPGLGRLADDPVGGLTYSERRWVEIARCLAGQPRVLLLDEPAAGMTASEVEALGSALEGLKGQGKAILLVDHRLELVFSVCDRIMVMNHGEMLASGTPDQIRANARVHDCYLGATAQERRRRRAAAGEKLLELHDVSLGYGGRAVLNGVTFSINRGELVCLVGPNATGKSTLLKAIVGRIPVQGGRIAFNGRDLGRLGVTGRVRNGIGLVPEGRRIFPDLTVEENLVLGGFTLDRGRKASRLQKVYDTFPTLADRRLQKGGTLSGGEQQMLAIGRALMSSPSLLLLDEPTMGLAPQMAHTVLDLIDGLNRDGITVIVVEQQARLVADMADRLLVAGGATIRDAGASEEAVEKVYFAQAADSR